MLIYSRPDLPTPLPVGELRFIRGAVGSYLPVTIVKGFPTPKNEKKRLQALAEYQIMDSPAEAEFDELTRLASYICQAPLAQISLVDDRRQWFKSRLGFALAETPRETSFCQHALLRREVLEIEDATKDERFADSALIRDEPHVRFYAGAPLVTPEDYALGALCVMDRKPRKLAPDQRDGLQILARQVVARLDLRRQQRRLRMGHRSCPARDCSLRSRPALHLCQPCLRGNDGKTGLGYHRPFGAESDGKVLRCGRPAALGLCLRRSAGRFRDP